MPELYNNKADLRDSDSRLEDYNENSQKVDYGLVLIYRVSRDDRHWNADGNVFDSLKTAEETASELLKNGIAVDWEIRREIDGALVNSMKQSMLPKGWE